MNASNVLFCVSKISNIRRGYKKFINFLRKQNVSPKNIVYGVEGVKDVDLNHFDKVILAGGDGFIRLFLNSLDSHHLKRLSFGILPFGTGNAFYYNLTGNTSLYVNLTRLMNNPHYKKKRLLKSNLKDSLALSSISVAFEERVIREYRDREYSKKISYFWATLFALINNKKQVVTYNIDGLTRKNNLFNFSIYNGEFVGKRARVITHLKEDGLNYSDDKNCVSYILNRKLWSRKKIKVANEISFPGTYNIQVDGDLFKATDLTVSLSEELNFFI